MLHEISVTHSSVAFLAGIDSQHVDKALFLVDFVEKAVTADSISPRGRLVVFEFFDVFSEMGIVSELRIDVIPELLSDSFALPLEILRQIQKELIGLKYPEITQPFFLFS